MNSRILLIVSIFTAIIMFAAVISAVNYAMEINREGIIETADEAEKGIVIFYADDVWGGWLEDITQELVELHIEKEIDLTVGVIPCGMTDDSKMTDSMIHLLQNWYANHSNVIEISQQGYNHTTEDYRIDYIKEGRDLFYSWGIRHYSWAPPYGKVEWNTTLYLEELGFHTIIDSDPSDTRDDTSILVLGQGPWADKEPASAGELKSAEELMKEADAFIKERGFVTISYYVHDFVVEDTGELNEEKFEEFAALLDAFKSSGYVFMTIEEYYQSLLI